MGKDVQVTKDPYQPNKSGKTESSNDSKNPLAASSAVKSNNNSNMINEVNHDSVAASSTGMKKDTTNQVDTLTEQSVTCKSNCCCKYQLILLLISLNFSFYLCFIQMGYGKKFSIAV